MTCMAALSVQRGVVQSGVVWHDVVWYGVGVAWQCSGGLGSAVVWGVRVGAAQSPLTRAYALKRAPAPGARMKQRPPASAASGTRS